jgi:ribonucleoside-diphosphate reductase alpha chain
MEATQPEERQPEKRSGEQSRTPSSRSETERRGICVDRYFTREGTHPYDEVEWERRTASIAGQSGEAVFSQEGVEVPKSWSQTATNIVAQKYFRGPSATQEREDSVRQMLNRVVDTITVWGKRQSYFRTEQDAETFKLELKHLLVHQKAAFNSPVWFNVGVDEHPQCSACFINAVDDTMDSILQLVHTEGMLFKWGSGTGTNFSSLRSSKEPLMGGGTASGPVSFMRGYDSFAGVIKSGGKTRRAAKMVILNVDHPDIAEFVDCKAEEERKAWALIDAGYDGSFNGEAYSSVFFQNSNNSVRCSDAFMKAAVEGEEWQTRAVTDPDRVMNRMDARDLMKKIAEAAHQCGDPGLQFDDTINRWHTCPDSGRINASNPCSEFMFLDNSACNLASLNLRRFQTTEGELDVEAFCKAVELVVLAQEIIVDNAKYPTAQIGENSRTYRPLGLGYANLGALLMSRGLPYDSEPGRAYAAAVTALMTGHAYLFSSRIAEECKGPFDEFEPNREPFLRVMGQHRNELSKIDSALVPYDLMVATRATWDNVLESGAANGFRNAQVSVLAPTGTIGFMMDCDTTGIEPDIALVKYKQLVGGGTLKLVNNSVAPALRRLGYSETEIEKIRKHIEENDTIEGSDALKDEHLPVFDCAMRPTNGNRFISPMGHVKMMAAVQKFISGAISKTVNLPADTTVEEIEDVYVKSWQMGLKAVAIYRDGCKRTQPVVLSRQQETRSEKKAQQEGAEPATTTGPVPGRHRLPQDRVSITHKFEVAGHEGYLTVGYYDNGEPGEIFIRMAKEGSTISGLMDSFATAVSLALQHGVPLKLFCDKFSHSRFEPSGFTNNQDIPMASSLMDYIFRWLALQHLETEKHPVGRKLSPPLQQGPSTAAQINNPSYDAEVMASASAAKSGESIASQVESFVRETDAPACPVCGFMMVRNGACHKCENCGATSGCS